MKKVSGLFFILTLCCVFGKAQQVVPSGGSADKKDFTVDWVLGGTLFGTNTFITIDPPGAKSAFIDNADAGMKIKVYPTIVEDFVIVEITSSENPDYFIELFNALGSKVIDRINMKQQSIRIKLSKLTSGIYLLTIANPSNGQMLNSEKIIKN